MPIFDPPTPPNSNSVVPQSAIDRSPAPVDVGAPAVPVVPRSAIDRKPDPVDPGVAIGTQIGPLDPGPAPVPVAAGSSDPVLPTQIHPGVAPTPATRPVVIPVIEEQVDITPSGNVGPNITPTIQQRYITILANGIIVINSVSITILNLLFCSGK